MNIESIYGERVRARARLHAALGDPHRLAIVDELALSDRTPSELAAILEIDSNLLAHHLSVLERLNLIDRVVSQGDRRRRYIQLVPKTIETLESIGVFRVGRVIFVCTENAARSQIAVALWNHLDTGVTAESGGTHPARRVHPKVILAAKRRGFELRNARPRPIPAIAPGDLVVTVCDRAHETLQATSHSGDIHWSVSDPLTSGQARAFEIAAEVLAERVRSLSSRVEAL